MRKRKKLEEIAYRKREAKQKDIDKQLEIEKINRANHTYAKCQYIPNHAYLVKKKMPVHPDYRINKCGDLIIPLRNHLGTITAHQQIYAVMPKDEKDKKIHGKAGESFFLFKPECCEISDLDMLFVCEGVATGYAIYDAINECWDSINYGVVCAMSAGNIDPVVNKLSKEFSNKHFVAIQDMDVAGTKTKTFGFPIGFTQGQDAWDIWNEFGSHALANIIQDKLVALSNRAAA